MNYVIKREQARELRKIGKSLREISQTLKVSKSSASIWCSDILLNSEQITNLKKNNYGYKLGALANKIKRKKEIDVIRVLAAGEINRLRQNDLERLKDVGTIIYWAEGTKKHVVDITNSDPELIKISMMWFRKVCKVNENKFNISIYYHYNQDENEIKHYWSEITGVPLNQFYKSILKKEGTGHRKNILYHGTCKIRINNNNLLQRILTWIEQFYI